jgi:rhodanese-related sulfurtransferase
MDIKIYNGGIKAWKAEGNSLESIEKLPEYEGEYISTQEFYEKLKKAEETACLNKSGKPLITILDFRDNEKLDGNLGSDLFNIKTKCPAIKFNLDELVHDEELIKKIPKEGEVVSVSETGNRDTYIMRYLFKFGYTNIKGLKFGMRDWLKSDYPIERIK